MSPTSESRWSVYRAAWREAGSPWRAVQFTLLYWAVRVWTLVVNVFPIELNLRSARLMGRFWWTISRKHRERTLNNLRPALGGEYPEAELRRIARASFEHFAQVYLVEAPSMPRRIQESNWGLLVETENLSEVVRELLRDGPKIMISPHFGNFELLGWVTARMGLPSVAVMRPLDNPLLNQFLVDSRAAGGMRLVFKRGATEAVEEALDSGEAVSFVADQDAGRKGVFAPFFGRPASWYKSIALLAIAKECPIVVGVAVRRRPGFAYRIIAERVIRPAEWRDERDPVRWITAAYAREMERLIRLYPEQYLWMHNRWKSQPRAAQPEAAARG